MSWALGSGPQWTVPEAEEETEKVPDRGHRPGEAVPVLST